MKALSFVMRATPLDPVKPVMNAMRSSFAAVYSLMWASPWNTIYASSPYSFIFYRINSMCFLFKVMFTLSYSFSFSSKVNLCFWCTFVAATD